MNVISGMSRPSCRRRKKDTYPWWCGGSDLDDQIERLVDNQIINPHIANAKKGSTATLTCEINIGDRLCLGSNLATRYLATKNTIKLKGKTQKVATNKVAIRQ